MGPETQKNRNVNREYNGLGGSGNKSGNFRCVSPPTDFIWEFLVQRRKNKKSKKIDKCEKNEKIKKKSSQRPRRRHRLHFAEVTTRVQQICAISRFSGGKWNGFRSLVVKFCADAAAGRRGHSPSCPLVNPSTATWSSCCCLRAASNSLRSSSASDLTARRETSRSSICRRREAALQ